ARPSKAYRLVLKFLRKPSLLLHVGPLASSGPLHFPEASPPWRSLEAVEFATLEWVAWFNTGRLLEPIGNIPPAEAEARYYAQRETTALAA
ncbi:hypothetical protein LHA35_27905, partial [Roseicella sp. GB24]|nr:hypothetical protein [Roseicella aerolata]